MTRMVTEPAARTEPYEVLNRLIASWQDEIVAAVQQSIRIPSVAGPSSTEAPNGPGVKEALVQSLALAESMGFRTNMPDPLVGYAEYGQGDEMVAVLGHLDVVPAGDGWTVPPFAGIIREGRLYGRGAVDDKGPILGALFALRALKEAGLPLQRRIRVIFGTDEETGCTDMARYKMTEELPVAGFTPDGQYPAINAEKGILTFRIRCPIGAHGVVQLHAAQGGSATNTVPDKAFIHYLDEDGILQKLRCQGKTAHSSLPHLGQNAIAILVDEAQELKLAPGLKKAIGFIRQKIGYEIHGNSLGIQFEDAPSGPLTCNLSMLDYTAPWLTWTVDIRYPVTMDGQALIQSLERQIREEGYEMELLTCRQPLYIPEDSPILKKLGKAYFRQMLKPFKPIGIGGGTYAKSLPNIVAFGPVFPDQPELCHLPDEFMSIRDLIKNVQIMAAALWELAQ